MPEITYRTIPVERIILHPDNPNELDDTTRARIRDSIEKTHLYPTLVVRSLEESIELRDAHAAEPEAVQLLNGHQRLDIIKSIGITEVRCEVWPAITDKLAKLYVLNLNDGGEDNPKKRQELLMRLQREMDLSIEDMTKIVRESAVEMQKMVELANRPPTPASPSRVGGTQVKSLQIFVSPEHEEIIESAILKAAREGVELDDPTGLAAEGARLAAICRKFLEQ